MWINKLVNEKKIVSPQVSDNALKRIEDNEMCMIFLYSQPHSESDVILVTNNLIVSSSQVGATRR